MTFGKCLFEVHKVKGVTFSLDFKVDNIIAFTIISLITAKRWTDKFFWHFFLALLVGSYKWIGQNQLRVNSEKQLSTPHET